MATYKRLNINAIFNMPYSPDFNGIESYFSLVKAEYKKLALQSLMRGEQIQAVPLVERSVNSIDNEKVKRCAKFGLTMIEI
jgi:hypothetical protein